MSDDPAPTPTVRAINCTSCGAPISLRAAGYSVSLICEHCGSTLDATDDAFKVIGKASQALAVPQIPLGSRGTVRGLEWEVVGFMRRYGDGAGWYEYLLFNPYHGYRFLIDDERRFSFGTMLDRRPEKIGGGRVAIDGDAYDRLSSYTARVSFVVGEFYWRVTTDDEVAVSDYARPGSMLSRERNDSEETWTRNELLPFGEVETAFGLAKRSRLFGRPAAHEESPVADMVWPAFWLGLCACIALIFMSAIERPSHDTFSTSVSARLDGPDHAVVYGPIDLPDRRTGVFVRAFAPTLDNSWVDFDYSLVERRSQISYDASTTAEFYSGYDSDGRWTEGNYRPVATFAGIPGGTYDLVIDAQAHRWTSGTGSAMPSYSAPPEDVPITIEIERGAFFAGPFWLAMLAIVAWPAALLYIHIDFGQRRHKEGGR